MWKTFGSFSKENKRVEDKMTLYMPLFRSCTTQRALTQLHAHLLVSGLQRDPLASTKLIETYAKMGNLESSQLVFNVFSAPDSFMYGVLIKSYVWNLFFREAISLYHEMLYEQTQVCSFIFPSLLKACSGLGDVGLGQKVHGRIVKSGFDSDGVVETALLCMYSERGKLDSARKIFDEMPVRDLVSWSSMVSSYVKNQRAHEGLEMFRRMVLQGVKADSVTMVGVIEACSELGFRELAKSVHGYIVRKKMDIDGSLGNSVIIMYSKCDDIDSAEVLFRKVSKKSSTSTTAMISCYNRHGYFREALETVLDMQNASLEPNSITMMGVIFSCSQLGWLREGESVLCYVIRRGMDPDFVLLGQSLIDMYACCGHLGNCQKVFDSIQEKSLALWNSLLAVYARNGLSEAALRLFIQLHVEGLLPDSFTLASSLSACGNISYSWMGNQIHAHITKTGFACNEFVHNSLIDMYSKCGYVDSAYAIFNELEQKSVVTWNSMIGGFAQNGNSVEAISLLDHIYSKGLEMNKVTFLSAIQACSHLGYLEKGRWFHNKYIVCGMETDSYVDTALIDMYSKCGDLRMARGVFDNMLEKTVVAWSAMIAGYGIHGHINAAISLFSQMVSSGTKPNEITFVGMLSACSHAGFVEEGKYYFNLMKQEFKFEPKLEHNIYMVDLLSRSGAVDDAYGFINSMTVPPSASIWGALLNGCRIHRRVDMIRTIERKILELEPENSGYYVLLSNTYAEGGNLEEFGKLRSMMKNIGLKKYPGYSTIEMNRKIYRFGSGDASHSQMKEIYRFLDEIRSLAKEHGYVLETDSPIVGIGKGTKTNNVQAHSEKLAIAYGIINTRQGATLRVSKNLRVCVDCHTFAKFVSKVTNRLIIMRDLNRFHHFADGICSCRDFW